MMAYLGAALIVLGCVAIGAWLVIEGHPWFGLFVLLIGASVKVIGND